MALLLNKSYTYLVRVFISFWDFLRVGLVMAWVRLAVRGSNWQQLSTRKLVMFGARFKKSVIICSSVEIRKARSQDRRISLFQTPLVGWSWKIM